MPLNNKAKHPKAKLAGSGTGVPVICRAKAFVLLEANQVVVSLFEKAVARPLDVTSTARQRPLLWLSGRAAETQ